MCRPQEVQSIRFRVKSNSFCFRSRRWDFDHDNGMAQCFICLAGPCVHVEQSMCQYRIDAHAQVKRNANYFQTFTFGLVQAIYLCRFSPRLRTAIARPIDNCSPHMS